jgi:oligopeptide transport system ATP-binding protein
MPEPLLQVENLRVAYGADGSRVKRGQPFAVDDVSFQLAAGTTLGVVGQSGAGKSTIGNCVVRLLTPTSGRIVVDGRDIAPLRGRNLRAIRRDLQMVFQDPYSSLDPYLRVRDIIEEPLQAFKEGNAQTRRRKVDELLDAVGLDPSHAERFPRHFSGGQRQRIAIARALALRPRLIVCDEAVSALDVSVRAQILNLLRDLQNQYGTAYLFISHDLVSIRAMSDDVAVLNGGRLVELGSADQVFRHPSHEHTRTLLESMPNPVPQRGGTDERS